ncbi:MAG: LysE family translocator [Rubricoccaceae bacterium]
MALDLYLFFLATTLVVVFSPGPAAVVAAGQGAASGVRASVFGTLGIAAANVVYFALSATGIAALLIASNAVFGAIKWAGVAYLLYLGASAILSRSGGLIVERSAIPFSPARFFARGFIIEISNPKALLYFTALLPQFLDPSHAVLPQLLVMGASTLALDLVAYPLYGALGDRLSKTAMKGWVVNAINRTAGGFLIFAGLKLATVDR